MVAYFNNCRARAHQVLYGAGAFYDLDNHGPQARRGRDVQPGDECVIATPVPGTSGQEIEFSHFKLSRVTVQENPTDPERRVCRVYWGSRVQSVRHPKKAAAGTPPYQRFFNVNGHFKQRSEV